jgi:hypothetical protein
MTSMSKVHVLKSLIPSLQATGHTIYEKVVGHHRNVEAKSFTQETLYRHEFHLSSRRPFLYYNDDDDDDDDDDDVENENEDDDDDDDDDDDFDDDD